MIIRFPSKNTVSGAIAAFFLLASIGATSAAMAETPDQNGPTPDFSSNPLTAPAAEALPSPQKKTPLARYRRNPGNAKEPGKTPAAVMRVTQEGLGEAVNNALPPGLPEPAKAALKAALQSASATARQGSQPPSLQPQASLLHTDKGETCSSGRQKKHQPSPNAFVDGGVLEGGDFIENGSEIAGLMADETMTKFGHEFFDAFVASWKPIENARYNIIIGERVDPMRGSMVSLRLDQNVIYEGFIIPKADSINELAGELAKETRNLVMARQNLEDEEFY